MQSLVPSMYAACQICEPDDLLYYEYHFYDILKNLPSNLSLTEHFEHFLSPNWTEEFSFCMDGRKLGVVEAYSESVGLCLFINSEKEIHDHSRLLRNNDCLIPNNEKMFFDFSVALHLSKNYSTQCMHNRKIKNGMTIELRQSKARMSESPYYPKDFVYPYGCLSDLGYLYIHSDETFRPTEAAWIDSNMDYSFVLKPKIMTSDENLRNLDPHK